MQGIYKITNKLNNKVYIGQATNLQDRIADHRQKRFVPIDMWINMIGVENFDFEILEQDNTLTQRDLDKKEREYIRQYESQNPTKGYNKQSGGFNNSAGEGNGRAKLTEADVRAIRTAYANHESCKQCYEKYKDKITYNSFQGVWQGRSWATIMPEVFTEENKAWYKGAQNKIKALLSKEQVLMYRQYYVNHTRNEVYAKYCVDCQTSSELLKPATFAKILVGDIRPESIYNTIPVYKKSIGRWELNGEPVSTIPGSGEQGYY